MRISDWSSDVCSSDLQQETQFLDQGVANCRREASCCTIWFLGFGCVARRYPGSGTEAEGRIIDPTDRFKSNSTPSSSWRARSEERRVGQECVRTFISRWSRYH